MSKKENVVTELLDHLDTIRPVLLAKKEREAEMRSTLRRMLSLLENLQNTPSIDPNLHRQVVTMLAMLFDAEHGLLLKRLDENTVQDGLLITLNEHLKNRRTLIDAAQQDLPATMSMLKRCFDLLGKPLTTSDDLNENLIHFEKTLRHYLQANSKVRHEFSLITSTLTASMEVFESALGEVGSESSDLKEAQVVLENELPSDPEQAQALLSQARQHILNAGKKLSSASKHVKETIASQINAMNVLAERLKDAEAQARNDPLTGLSNRRKLREYFETLEESSSTTFLMIDIDFFKHINDQYGHDAGDAVLERLGQLLKVAVRSTDMAARLGGEEFCIVLPETSIGQGAALAEKIRLDVSATNFQTQHGSIDVKVSIGVAQRTPNESIASWLKQADSALYKAKQNGRNQVMTAT